ncbi:cytochrome P450 [Aspergillus keveii]|uniref:Cytochrome P450 n=1 Tax=Aspergillus keveii TaxID=714993 RepID=A0ABR4G702_9EURO
MPAVSGSDARQTLFTLAVLGLASHTFFIRYNNVDPLVGKCFLPYIYIQSALWLWLSIQEKSVLASTVFIALANASFWTPLLASITLYRIYFHPLRKYPGPSVARFTSWWGVWKLARGANRYQLHDELHRRYGDIVRIAPNYISVNRVDALAVFYGAGTQCGKSHTFYNLKDVKSLQTETDLKKHKTRRPPWEKALNARQCLEYLPQLYRLSDLLITRVAEDAVKSTRGVMINHWLTCFSFDMMGELGYNKSYGCLETGVVHRGIIDMETAIATAVVISPLPWLVRILSSIVGVPSHLKGFMNLAIEARAERKAATTVSKTDVLSQVFDGNVPLTAEEEIEDTMLLQIGGSDTTNSTLIFCVYYIATNSAVQRALREEIQPSHAVGEEVTWENIKSLPLLEAAINETLRMHPPVPGGMPRMTPPQGAHLGDLYVPGNTTVSCPTWTIQMDPANFTDPTRWNPHRWINHPAEHNTKAWVPFSVGPFSCVGKNFAYMEMKVAIAKLVTQFEIALTPQEDGRALLEGSKDNTATVCKPVWLSMKPRGDIKEGLGEAVLN